MSRLMSRLSTAGALGAVLVIAGCGGGSSTPSTPQGELVAAVTQLGDANVLTTTIRLETTATALQGIAQASGNTLTPSTADAIASAQLVLESQKGNGGHTNASFRAIDAGKTLAELRVVGQTIYLQADVTGALTLFKKEGSLSGLQAQAAQLPTFAQAFLAGKWVSLDSGALSALSGLTGAVPGSSDPSEGPKLLAELKGVLSRDVVVKKLGSDSRGDHLMLTGDTNKLAADIRATIASSVPGGGALTDRLSVGSGPGRSVTLEAWVKGGALSEISLDLAQFAPKDKVPAGASLPITMTFDQSGDDISAPAGAVPVDLTQLGGLFTGAVSGGSTGASSGSGAPTPAISPATKGHCKNCQRPSK